MKRREFLSQALGLAGCGVAASLSGCGTIFHHERIHEPHSREIDWKIAAMDGLGLALFFVPGVVAFVVDFSTGAIYLPPDGSSGYAAAELKNTPASGPPSVVIGESGVPLATWDRVDVPPIELQPQRIEAVVNERMNRTFSMRESQLRVSELANLSHYRQQCRRHKQDAHFGLPAEAFFGHLLPS